MWTELHPLLRDYLAEVIKKWWAYVGLLLAVSGYIVSVYTPFVLPGWIWVLGSVAIFGVAQFSVYADLRRKVAPLLEKPPEMAIWAYHSTSANADGAWVTTLIWGDGSTWDTKVSQALIDDILVRLNMSGTDAEIELFADVVRVRVPKGHGTSDIWVQVGQSPPTIVWQYRSPADPVDFDWVLSGLSTALAFGMSSLGELVVASGARRRAMFGLSGWPASGVSTTSFANAKRPYRGQPFASNRVVSPHRIVASRSDLEKALSDFASAVLRESGWVDFEAELQAKLAESIARLCPVPVQPPKGRFLARFRPRAT